MFGCVERAKIFFHVQWKSLSPWIYRPPYVYLFIRSSFPHLSYTCFDERTCHCGYIAHIFTFIVYFIYRRLIKLIISWGPSITEVLTCLSYCLPPNKVERPNHHIHQSYTQKSWVYNLYNRSFLQRKYGVLPFA